jgi:hypothetical protein
MSCPINPPLFDHPNNTWQKVLIIKVAPPLYNCIQPPFTSFLLIQDAVISCSLIVGARDQLSRPFRTKCIYIPEGYNFVCKSSKLIMFINEHTYFFMTEGSGTPFRKFFLRRTHAGTFFERKALYIYTYEGRPESEDHLAIKKNKQSKKQKS